MSRNNIITWATVTKTKFNTREPSAQYAFSANFNAPLPEDSELLCDPCSAEDEDDVSELRKAIAEPGERISYNSFRRKLEH